MLVMMSPKQEPPRRERPRVRTPLERLELRVMLLEGYMLAQLVAALAYCAWRMW